jgi:hypothetical protein
MAVMSQQLALIFLVAWHASYLVQLLYSCCRLLLLLRKAAQPMNSHSRVLIQEVLS